MEEPLLRISDFHHSYSKARSLVDDAIQQFSAAVGDDEQVVFVLGESELAENYRVLVDRVRRDGVLPKVQGVVDNSDPIFGGTLSGTSSVNHQLNYTVEWAGWSAKARGPFRSYPAHWELTNDILHYRREACSASDQPDLAACTRAYRGYLSACIAIVDAFINRYILRAKFDGFESEEFSQLQEAASMQKKIELWHACFTTVPDPSFFVSHEWSEFFRLRDRRNRLVHAADPVFLYSVREIKRDLNSVRIAIGGMLSRMRRCRDEPIPGFVQRLQSAPRVFWRKVTFKATGEHDIKEVQ